MTSWRARLMERVRKAVKRAHDEMGLVDPTWVDADANAEAVTSAALDIAIPAILERAAERCEAAIVVADRSTLDMDQIANLEGHNLACEQNAAAIRSLKDNPDVEA